jgi:hypothetical protein
MVTQAKGKGASRSKRPDLDTTQAAAAEGDTTTATESWTAYDIFQHCIERANNLLKLHAAAHGRRAKPEKYMSDAHRAAIVLSVSALDAFIRTFVIERVRYTLADQSISLPGSLRDKITKFLKPEELIEAARRNDLLERVEKAFRSDFERRSFQGTRVIAEYMEIVGFSDIFHDVAKNAGCNEDTLRQNLDKFTNRRHEIAHRGDYDLSNNPPSENIISKKEAAECIKVTELVALQIHKMGAGE